MNKIVYDDYAYGAREVAYCGSNTTQQLVNNVDVYGKTTVDGNTRDCIFVNTTPYHCVCFDNGGIDLSKTAHIYASGDQVGFVSTTISDETGTFATPPVLEILFSGNDSFSGNGISLYFNTHYCKRVKVQYYKYENDTYTEILPSDGNLFYDVLSLVAYLPRTVEAYKKIVITFLTSEQPFQRAMVSMVTFGKTHELTKIHSLQYHKKLYFDCSDIAIGTLDAVFQSDDELNFFRNQKLQVYHKKRESDNYTLIGTYWVAEAERQTDVLYSVTGEDAFGQLNNVTTKSILGYAQDLFYVQNVFDEIEDQCGINITCSERDGYYRFYGYMPLGKAREKVANIAFAIQRFIKVNNDASIVLFDISKTVSKTICPYNIIGNSTFTKSDKLNSLTSQLVLYTLGGDGNTTEIYTGDIDQNGIFIETTYPIKTFFITQNGSAVLDGYSYLHDYPSELSITATNGTIHDVSVVVSGYASYVTSIEKNTQLSYGEIASNKKYDKPFFIEDITFFDPVVSETYKTKINDLCERVFIVNGEVRASYIGDDLDVGDYVSIETKYSGTLKGTVTEITGDVGYSDTIQNVVITVWQAQ